MSVRSDRSTASVGAALVALVFIAFHLPYLPASLEDVDSVNFALGVRQFDVTKHQPHPPGYPLFILVAKVVHRVVPDEAKALALVEVLAGTAGVFVLAALFRRLDQRDRGAGWSLAATVIAVTAPLYWFTAIRPLSDVAGLVAALAVQLLALSAATATTMGVAALAAGVATGFRSQVVWLTVPLLAFVILRGSKRRIRVALSCAVAFGVGCLTWAVPLVLLSGGVSAYVNVLFNQGTEDLTNIQMLWTTPTVRELASALYYALVAPWARWELAAAVLALGLAGVWRMVRADRSALLMLAVAFGPYFLFDLLFQETFTSRYALPLVVPVAYLAANGLAGAGPRIGGAIAIVLAMFSAHVAGTSVAAYASEKAPAFRLLDDFRSAERGMNGLPVLGSDRREDFDLRRPLVWLGEAAPGFAGRLAAPPIHEWLEPVKYWNGGGRQPLWFVTDPRRAQVDLIQHGDPTRYRWSIPYPVLLGGVRPNDMDWYRLDRPEWYLGQGWAITPEAAGVSDLDRRGLTTGPIEGWVRGSGDGVVVMIGGRNFEPTMQPRLRMAIGETVIKELTVAPGAFLETLAVPSAVWASAPDYRRLEIRAEPPSKVAIEQFDLTSERPLLGFGAGWQEQEYNSTSGLRWRWLSERGELRSVMTRPVDGVLHIEGESPRSYFSRASRLVVRMGDRVLLDTVLSSDFSLDVVVPNDRVASAPAAARTITLETDQVFVPAEGWRPSADRRHLGLRIFKCELRWAS